MRPYLFSLPVNPIRQLGFLACVLALLAVSQAGAATTESPCNSILHLVDRGRLEEIEVPNDPALHKKVLPRMASYVVRIDINRDRKDELFVATAEAGNDFGITLLDSDGLDLGKLSAAEDVVAQVMFDAREKRVAFLKGQFYVIVFNSIGTRHREIEERRKLFEQVGMDPALVRPLQRKRRDSIRAIWQITSDFRVRYECEVGRFVRSNGTTYHRILASHERIARTAKEQGIDPWEWVAKYREPQILDVLQPAGWSLVDALPPNDLWKPPIKPIWAAIHGNRLDLVKAFLLKGVSPNIPEHVEKNSRSPIEFAIWHNKVDLARVLIETAGPSGLKLHLIKGNSPLAEAVELNHTEIADMFLNAGTKLDSRVGLAWISWADSTMFNRLLNHGLDIHKTYWIAVIAEGLKREGEATFMLGPEIKTVQQPTTMLQYARRVGSKKAEDQLVKAGALE